MEYNYIKIIQNSFNNLEVYLDGVEVSGIRNISYENIAGEPPVINIEMIVQDLEININK